MRENGELPPVPVAAGTVGEREVPIYLEGLGTVQAWNTVTIHVRVDGQLDKVAFTEGQDVKEGDLLRRPLGIAISAGCCFRSSSRSTPRR